MLKNVILKLRSKPPYRDRLCALRFRSFLHFVSERLGAGLQSGLGWQEKMLSSVRAFPSPALLSVCSAVTGSIEIFLRQNC